MATLLELKTIFDDALRRFDEGVTPPPEAAQAKDLLNKVEAAVWKKAHALITTERPPVGPAANEATGWAQNALQSSSSAALTAFKAMLAANSAASTTAILGADDAAIEGALDAVVDQLAKGSHPGRR